jgi:hypothetical protein
MRVAVPSLADVEAAPEMATVAVAVMVVLAVRRALEAAHPIVLFEGTAERPLDDVEHAAMGVLLHAEWLLRELSTYADATREQLRDEEESLPF